MFGKKVTLKGQSFVDLGVLSDTFDNKLKTGIKVVDVKVVGDLKPLTDFAYHGDILVMDFSNFSEGDSKRKEMSAQLAKVADDLNGTFTETTRLMILSPNGQNIDKISIKHTR